MLHIKKIIRILIKQKKERKNKVITTILRNEKELILKTNKDGCIYSINDSWKEDMALYNNNSVIYNFIDVEGVEELKQKVAKVLGGEFTFIELTFPHFQSRTFNFLMMPDVRNGETIGVQFVGQDITKEKDIEKKMKQLAYYDTLTGIPNRYLFDRFVTNMINSDITKRVGFSILFLDLNEFKQVNDNYGHQVGDELLKGVAVRLENSVGNADLVARLSGDEFLVFLNEVNKKEEVLEKVKRIITCLKEPIKIGECSFNVKGSIGVSRYPEDSKSLKKLIKKADMAMYHSKKEKISYRFYHSNILLQKNRETMIEGDLRGALKNNELRLEYQPQFEIKTGKPVGVEALIRWKHPTLGEIPPNELIEVAEKTRDIHDIGIWIMNKVTTQIKKWEKDIGDEMTISINVSPIQLYDQYFVTKINDMLEENQIDANKLKFEITEGQLIEEDEVFIDNIQKIKDVGIDIVIDDFGAGYTSLNYLKKYPFNYLKIDKQYIDDIGKSEKDKKIVHSIIKLAHELNYRVVAEGVETKEQYTILKRMECDYVQGFLMSKPLNKIQIMNVLKEG